ncbi:hypothetical protein A2U01_0090028, partial [Trifolium medium]|nr:hypothetical protein [Trifolium medium]
SVCLRVAQRYLHVAQFEELKRAEKLEPVRGAGIVARSANQVTNWWLFCWIMRAAPRTTACGAIQEEGSGFLGCVLRVAQ